MDSGIILANLPINRASKIPFIPRTEGLNLNSGNPVHFFTLLPLEPKEGNNSFPQTLWDEGLVLLSLSNDPKM
jgi:hypothetical protein